MVLLLVEINPPSQTGDDMDDDKNPEMMFQTTDTDLLVKAVNCQIDLNALAASELSARGLDDQGKWIGFDKSEKLLDIEIDESAAHQYFSDCNRKELLEMLVETITANYQEKRRLQPLLEGD